MVSLDEKVKALELLEIDTNPFLIAELYELSLRRPIKKFKYYKQYGDWVMYYSEEYLEKTPIEELLFKDVCNQIQ